MNIYGRTILTLSGLTALMLIVAWFLLPMFHPSPFENDTFVMDATSLMLQSRASVEKVLGPARQYEKDHGEDPDDPGDAAEYIPVGKHCSVYIRYVADQAYSILVTLDHPASNYTSALQRIGLTISQNPDAVAPAAVRWEMISIHNVQYKELVVCGNQQTGYSQIDLEVSGNTPTPIERSVSPGGIGAAASQTRQYAFAFKN